MAFYKGYIPAFVRLGPQTILTFIFFEQLRMNFGFFPEQKWTNPVRWLWLVDVQMKYKKQKYKNQKLCKWQLSARSARKGFSRKAQKGRNFHPRHSHKERARKFRTFRNVLKPPEISFDISEHFWNRLENFETIWKDLDSFKTVRKDLRPSRNNWTVRHWLESFQLIQTYKRPSGQPWKNTGSSTFF